MERLRARILEVLEQARTLDDLRDGLVFAVPLGVATPALLGLAIRFISHGDPSGLSPELRSAFARALSRVAESPRVTELTAILEDAGPRLT